MLLCSPARLPLSASPRANQSMATRVVHLTGGHWDRRCGKVDYSRAPLEFGRGCVPGPLPAMLGAMPDRHFPAVDNLARRAGRVAAGRPDPIRILAKTITMTGVIGMDPYAVLGTLVEGAVQTILQQVPQERQAETAETLVALLKERLAACGITNDEDGDGQQSS